MGKYIYFMSIIVAAMSFVSCGGGSSGPSDSNSSKNPPLVNGGVDVLGSGGSYATGYTVANTPGSGVVDVWKHVICPSSPNSGTGFRRVTSLEDLPNDPIGDGENNCYMEAFNTSVFTTDHKPISGCDNIDMTYFPDHTCIEVRTGDEFKSALAARVKSVVVVMNDVTVNSVPYIAGDHPSTYLFGLYDTKTLRPVLVRSTAKGTLVNWNATSDPNALSVTNLRLHTQGMCFSIGKRKIEGIYVFQSVSAKCNGRFVISSYESPTRAGWSGGVDYPNSLDDLTEWPTDDRIYFREVMTRGNRSHTVYIDRSFLSWVQDSIIMVSSTSGKHAAKFESQNVFLHNSIFTNTGIHNQAIIDPEFSSKPRRSNLAALSLAACSRVLIDHVTIPYHYERAEANARPIQWQIRDAIGGACDMPWSYYPNTYPAIAYHGPTIWLSKLYAQSPFWDPSWWDSIDDSNLSDPNMIVSMVLSTSMHVTAEKGFNTKYLHSMGSVGTYPSTRDSAGSARNFRASSEVPSHWKERQRIIVNNNCLDDGIPLANATQNYYINGMETKDVPPKHKYDNTDKFVVVGSQSCSDVTTTKPWIVKLRDDFLRSLPSPPWSLETKGSQSTSQTPQTGKPDKPNKTQPPAGALADEPSIISLLKRIKPASGIQLPEFSIKAPYGGLDAYENFKSYGPGIRDYSMKWVYASDRGSALYAGANHGVPHKFDDVWEYFLGSNTWVLLHAPDTDARPLHTWWGLTYDPKHSRLYWMAPQTSVSNWALVENNANPPLVYFEPSNPSAGWRYLPTTPAIKAGTSAALEYIPDSDSLVLWARAWNGAGLQQLDTKSRKWKQLISHDEAYHNLQDTSPRPEALVGYNPKHHTLVGFVDKDVFSYSFSTNKWSKVGSNILPVDVKDNISSMAYDPKRDLYFLVSKGELFTFDPTNNRVKNITPNNFPNRGKLLMLYVDQRLDLVVVYEKNSPKMYVYRPV